MLWSMSTCLGVYSRRDVSCGGDGAPWRRTRLARDSADARGGDRGGVWYTMSPC